MSIVEKILNRYPKETISVASPRELTRNIYCYDQLLSRQTALDIRSRLLGRAKSNFMTYEDSWAAKRYQSFNEKMLAQYADDLRALVERDFRKNVRFTYNYNAIYPSDGNLKNHVDRIECDYNFLIFLGDESRIDNRSKIISFQRGERTYNAYGEIGDAILFEGRKMAHGRSLEYPVCNFMTSILHYENE